MGDLKATNIQKTDWMTQANYAQAKGIRDWLRRRKWNVAFLCRKRHRAGQKIGM